jgi:hypothetical protein
MNKGKEFAETAVEMIRIYKQLWKGSYK